MYKEPSMWETQNTDSLAHLPPFSGITQYYSYLLIISFLDAGLQYWHQCRTLEVNCQDVQQN